MAYVIFIVEKEMHVGSITDEYPILKVFNLVDDYNLKRFNKESKEAQNSTKTFG